MKVVGLFAGIGGIELGLKQAGHETVLLCEIDPSAGAVLKQKFSGIQLEQDIRKLRKLPQETELLTGGFPCQDISQAGNTKGISGQNSGLVDEIFRLLEKNDIPHVLLENVSFILSLDRGHAMRHIIARFEKLGYRWAYRLIDTRSFGLPQRRQRLFLVASRVCEPLELLLSGSFEPHEPTDWVGKACGFYWTEGVRGLGWAVDAIPTLKGGSTVGIASPPAIWLPNGRIVTPSIRDAERLQGFEPDWTEAALSINKSGFRWKLVGNAVSVPVAKWIGQRFLDKSASIEFGARSFDQNKKWPVAAFGGPGQRPLGADLTLWPVKKQQPPLEKFLVDEPKLLSHKATVGFISRLRSSSLKYPPRFLVDLENHAKSMQCQLTLPIAA
jgi:DNA (cytosine-5)-methyltransferase 1